LDQSLEESEAASITLYEPVPVFTKTDAWWEGDQFVIVTEADGKTVAFAYDGEAIVSRPVEPTGDVIRDPDAAVIWYGREDNTVESVGAPGAFIFSGSYGLMVFTGGRTFEYDAETGHILMHKMYYLTYDAATGRFDQSLEESEAAAFTLYGRVMPKSRVRRNTSPTAAISPVWSARGKERRRLHHPGLRHRHPLQHPVRPEQSQGVVRQRLQGGRLHRRAGLPGRHGKRLLRHAGGVLDQSAGHL
jgi:hypothetical protein